MKSWTIEELTELWIYRGYSKKDAKAAAKVEFNEMHRKKTAEETHRIMQEMLYN